MTPIITLTDLWDAMDKFFKGNPHMSSDPREAESDRIESERLFQLSKRIPGGHELWAGFCAWNMSQWDKSEKYPKPERPTEVLAAL